jgi:hypothetical protein
MRLKNNSQSIVGFGHKRERNDFYPTPPATTHSLMKREKFDGLVWECASGNGAMSKVIEQYNECISSDIGRRKDIYGNKGVDFLKTTRKVDNIVTNPPYRLAEEFISHALQCADKKVAMLLKLVFLEGTGRYDLFQNTPLKTVYVFCRRQRITIGGKKMKNSSMIAYAWFVWDKSHSGKPTISWINDDNHKEDEHQMETNRR